MTHTPLGQLKGIPVMPLFSSRVPAHRPVGLSPSLSPADPINLWYSLEQTVSSTSRFTCRFTDLRTA